VGTAADTNVPLNVTENIIANPSQSFLNITVSPTEYDVAGMLSLFRENCKHAVVTIARGYWENGPRMNV
jgi:hypothetical protein